MKIDLSAPIVPGQTAAGLKLGMQLSEFAAEFVHAKEWQLESQIQEAIAACNEWLHIRSMELKVSNRISHDYYFRHGALRLSFDPNQRLVMITLSTGYVGTLFGSIRIGDALEELTKFVDISYDDVDELHHASRDQHEIGLSVYADEYSLSASPDQKISRIFVHEDFL